MIKPNTFIIGAQKAATTSLYNWVAQHPDICGPNSLKDYPFFFDDDYFSKGLESLEKEYIRSGYSQQKIVLQGYVNYMFYPKSIEMISEFDSNSKLICVLRDPTDRAISAYNYFRKLNLETLSLKEALKQESKRSLGTQREINNLTYKAHGLYAKQLEYVFKYFNPNQVLVLFYENIKTQPQEELNKIFRFLGVNSDVEINTDSLNVTGAVRFNYLNKVLYNNNKFKKFVINKLVDPILPLHRRINIKLAILSWNTSNKSNKGKNDNYKEEKLFLKDYFRDDIEKLEKLINVNLKSWK